MLTPYFSHPQSGFSLMEILVSLVAGLLVIATGISLLTTVLVTANTNLLLSRLNQEVQMVLDIISYDLQRTGYHPDTAVDLAAIPPGNIANSYLFSWSQDLYPLDQPSYCLRVKYWDRSGSSGKQAVRRIYSYDQALQTLRVRIDYGPPNGTPLSTLCATGNRLVSDQEILIVALNFTPTMINNHPQAMSALTLTIRASHAHRTELSIEQQRLVYLRNQATDL